MFEQLEEVLALVEQTGDRCIVLHEKRQPFVVMNLTQYRTLLAAAARVQDLSKMSETELLDMINDRIAEWRQSKADELAGFELSQFRIDLPSQPLEGHPRPGRARDAERPRARADRMANLPVVESDEEDEYQLEPPA